MSDERDEVLAGRAIRGDVAAFGELVRRHQGAVYRLCRRYVDDAEAEDVAQEAFVRAFVHVRSFDASRPLAPWLLTIARRLCLDKLRRAKVRPALAAGALREPSCDVTGEGELESRETMAALFAALAELPAPQRDAVLLFHVEGLAYKDIASALEVPLGTVMTWLHRGRAHLRARLAGLPPSSASSKLRGGDA